MDIRPADDRLPGEDAVQGRGGGQEGRPAVRDRSAALPGPVDQAQGQVNLYQAQLKLARTTYAARQRHQQHRARVGQPAAARPGPAAVEEAEARVKAYEKNMEVYRLNQEFTRVVSPIDGHGQPLLPDARQPREPGPDAAHHGRLAGPDVCLLRRGRAHRAADPQGDQRGADASGASRGRSPC